MQPNRPATEDCVKGVERFKREGCECDRQGRADWQECIYEDPCPNHAAEDGCLSSAHLCAPLTIGGGTVLQGLPRPTSDARRYRSMGRVLLMATNGSLYERLALVFGLAQVEGST